MGVVGYFGEGGFSGLLSLLDQMLTAGMLCRRHTTACVRVRARCALCFIAPLVTLSRALPAYRGSNSVSAAKLRRRPILGKISLRHKSTPFRLNSLASFSRSHSLELRPAACRLTNLANRTPPNGAMDIITLHFTPHSFLRSLAKIHKFSPFWLVFLL